MDQTDINILKVLRKNCRTPKKEIAEKVHLTAPAVATRINHLEDNHVIKNYTIDVDTDKLGYTHPVFIQTEMLYYNHKKYLEFIKKSQHFIKHHYKISGNMNYMIEAAFHSNNELDKFLINLSNYAKYQVFDIISEIS